MVLVNHLSRDQLSLLFKNVPTQISFLTINFSVNDIHLVFILRLFISSVSYFFRITSYLFHVISCVVCIPFYGNFLLRLLVL